MDYLERAAQIGQDTEALKKGETVETTETIKSLEDFKKNFANEISADQREAFSKQVSNANEVMQYREEDNLDMMRVMDNVYGDTSLSATDTDYSDKVFPITVNATSGSVLTIDSEIEVGPGAAPYFINAETLIFDGGSITVRSTSLTINVDNLIIKQGGGKPYHIGILGNSGALGATGTDGTKFEENAQAGDNRSAPSPGICTGASAGGAGEAGDPGGKGSEGKPGGAGQPNLPAQITIGAYDPSNASPLVLYTQSGAGGKGGTGGLGGNGQNGGKGGNGCDSGCEGTDGGNGNKGGAGGVGGVGGVGGNGTSGNNIIVNFPEKARNMLQTLSDSALAGKGGDGGGGGTAGTPGKGGSGGKHAVAGKKGSGASDGDGGADGADGEETGAPGNFSVTYT